MSHKDWDKGHVSGSLPDLVIGGQSLPVPGTPDPGLRLLVRVLFLVGGEQACL